MRQKKTEDEAQASDKQETEAPANVTKNWMTSDTINLLWDTVGKTTKLTTTQTTNWIYEKKLCHQFRIDHKYYHWTGLIWR